ncbi:helix-turn-helix domain-containing protein [Polaromonas sp.]|uniref:helix-turn-helix domain-containing protein n=1 Tax=Polaromonas sp. TaxID=1869339 RepID=UPI002FCBC660
MNDYPVRSEQQVPMLLKSFRKARGMTQADLARAMGVTQQTASDLERNASSASVSRLLRLLSAIGVELVLRDKQADTKVLTPDQSETGKSGPLDW